MQQVFDTMFRHMVSRENLSWGGLPLPSPRFMIRSILFPWWSSFCFTVMVSAPHVKLTASMYWRNSEISQSVYCSYIFYIFVYFCKAPITSYIFAHLLYFPVFLSLFARSLFAQHRILLSIRNFYTTVVSYLLDKFPLSNGLLQDLGCLNPLCRDDPTGIVAIRRVAE